MKDQDKSKDELIQELLALKQAYNSLKKRCEKDCSGEKELQESEANARAIMESTNEVLLLIDKNGIILDCNEAHAKRLNSNRKDLLGKNVFQLLPKEVAESRFKLIQEVVSTGKMVRSEDFRGGYWNEFMISPIIVENKISDRVAIYARDITEQKMAEKAIHESEERFRSLLQGISSVSVQGYSPDGTTQYWNKASEELYGYTAQEAIGRNLLDLIIPPEMQEGVKLAIQQMAETGQAVPSSELLLMRRDGSRVPVFSSHSIVKISGKPQELFCIDIDLTERKHIEDELLELNGKLEELNATKDKFFSIIAHDLKSPFNSILGFSNLLMEEIQQQDYEKVGEYAEIIQKSSLRAFDLLINLLDWSQSQTGKIKFVPENIEMVSLIQEVVELLADSARQKLITVTQSLPSAFCTFADKAVIKTILRNLITNAIKFTHSGGQIVISAARKKDVWILSIEDNGIGINNNALVNLFHIEKNVSTLGTNMEKGTGLGLVLCKEFVEKHGGEIWVESVEGKGSKFSFTIPAKIDTAD